MKYLNTIISITIIMAGVFLCRQIIDNSLYNQKNCYDYAELNQIQHGMLNVDEWKRQISVIIYEKINTLDLSKTDENALRNTLEVELNTLIDKVDGEVRDTNSRSIIGWVKQSFINVFVSADDIKKDVPKYADVIIREMEASRTKDQIRGMLKRQIESYSKKIFSTQDTSHIKRILIETGSSDVTTAREKLGKEISSKSAQIGADTAALIILCIIPFALIGIRRRPLTSTHNALLVSLLLILLTAGVTTPMINLEAKITKLSFMLMGHSIHFENQELYFQSKSILDVFWVLIKHEDIVMKFVGALVVTFSIIFPFAKILSSLGYYYNYRGARQNRLVTFFALKSGKWSMADVLVIAIFMAYVGSNGIISNALGMFRSASSTLNVLTTNGTSLQPGYYLFLAYTLLAMFMPAFLQRRSKPEEMVDSLLQKKPEPAAH
jgi:hypothetical protein